MLPLFLDVTDRPCLVVGGGPVGRRKAAALLDAGAHVRLVCLEPRPTELTAAALEWLDQPYRPDHLDGVCLAIAAATPEVNRQVVSDARARGLWVNAATEPHQGDVHLPAVLRRGGLTVAVGTDGHAPGLARTVRSLLAEVLDDTFDAWLELVKELRRRVLDEVADAGRRAAVLEHFCCRRWLERLRTEGAAAVRAAMHADYQQLVGPPPRPL
jgi:precorrin-2 dehydrogenase/sirohydrochlorin ferrochelatase